MASAFDFNPRASMEERCDEHRDRRGRPGAFARGPVALLRLRCRGVDLVHALRLQSKCECAAFWWQTARGWLDGLSHGRGLNIAHEAVDRHASGPRAGKAALRWQIKSLDDRSAHVELVDDPPHAGHRRRRILDGIALMP